MNARTDQQLLHEYLTSRSDAAFTSLVQRHLDLVYSAACRRVGDPHLAQDVTQATFAALAQNARQLADHPVLSGWLHRTTQNLAANLIRTNTRRAAREQEAFAMNQLLADSETGLSPVWTDIAPHLDAALDELDPADRDAVLLRYFEKKSARDMAAQLGISDDAAQKRVSRAVEKLRELFAKRGVTVGTGALAVVVSANAVQAAPAGLALAISATALAGTAATATTLIAATTKTIAMTTLQKTLVTATVAVLAGAGIYEARQTAQLRDQVQTLQQQQAPLAEQIDKLQNDLNASSNRASGLFEELAGAKKNNSELLKLRGEVGQLRRQVANLVQPSQTKPVVSSARQPKAQAHVAGTYVSKDKLQFVGYETPEAAIESTTWAMMSGTFEQANEGLSPELATSEATSQKEKKHFESRQQMLAPLLKGIQIVARKDLSDGKVELKMKMDSEPIPGQSQAMPPYMIQPLSKVGGQWKISGSTREYTEQWNGDAQIQTYSQ